MKLRKLQRSEQILLALILVVCAFLAERTLVEGLQIQRTALELRTEELRKAVAKAQADKAEFGKRDLASFAAFPPTAELELAGASSDKISKFLSELAEQESDERFRIVKLATEPAQTIGPTAAAASGQTLGPPAAAAGDDYVRTPVLLDVEAAFPAIGRFLEKLEDSPFLAEVDSLEVYRMENDLRLCSARIRLLSYAVRK